MLHFNSFISKKKAAVKFVYLMFFSEILLFVLKFLKKDKILDCVTTKDLKNVLI